MFQSQTNTIRKISKRSDLLPFNENKHEDKTKDCDGC